MYTRCPHCTTIFQITAGQLRVARGDVPCVTCAQTFNALESLSDDVTALITQFSAKIAVVQNDDNPDVADTWVEPQAAEDAPNAQNVCDDDESDPGPAATRAVGGRS